MIFFSSVMHKLKPQRKVSSHFFFNHNIPNLQVISKLYKNIFQNEVFVRFSEVINHNKNVFLLSPRPLFLQRMWDITYFFSFLQVQIRNNRTTVTKGENNVLYKKSLLFLTSSQESTFSIICFKWYLNCSNVFDSQKHPARS